MLRIRYSLPKGITYQYLDILHDALIEAWDAAGVPSEQIVGESAKPWHFAPLGRCNTRGKFVHTLVVGTSDLELATHLSRIKPGEIKKARALTAEAVSFANAEMSIEPDPILPGTTVLGVLLLSPLLISDRNARPKKRWHTDLRDCDLDAAINTRLSRLAGRPVNLSIQPDSLYLRCNPKHSVRVPTKLSKTGNTAFVLGMQAPLVISGSEEDLRLAWYAGIGEKTRNGFGCLGLAEQGVGR